MARRLCVIITLFAFASSPGNAIAQQYRQTLKQQLVGTWTLVWEHVTQANGNMVDPYGPRGKGTLIFEQNGRFALILVNPDVAKFASSNRLVATPAELEAAWKGSNAFFGTYTVNDPSRTFTFHVEGASDPNIAGTDQERSVKTITTNDLDFAHGNAELLYRRVK